MYLLSREKWQEKNSHYYKNNHKFLYKKELLNCHIKHNDNYTRSRNKRLHTGCFTMAKRVLFICMIPLFIIASGVTTLLTAQDDVAAALYQEGLKKYILEDYMGALEDFESAIKLDPDNDKFKKMHLNTLIKQGNREYERGNLPEAEYYFSRAYRLSGEDEELRAMLDLIQADLWRSLAWKH